MTAGLVLAADWHHVWAGGILVCGLCCGWSGCGRVDRLVESNPRSAVDSCLSGGNSHSLAHSLAHSPPLSHKGCFTYSGRHTFEIFKLTIFLGTNRFVFICFTAKLTSASDEPTTITCFSVKKNKKTGQTLQSDQVRPLQGQELKNFERHQ